MPDFNLFQRVFFSRVGWCPSIQRRNGYPLGSLGPPVSDQRFCPSFNERRLAFCSYGWYCTPESGNPSSGCEKVTDNDRSGTCFCNALVNKQAVVKEIVLLGLDGAKYLGSRLLSYGVFIEFNLDLSEASKKG